MMVAKLSADIVRSTSLEMSDLIELRHKILYFLDEMERKYEGFWGRMVKGDSIECYIPDCDSALRIAILIKLLVKRVVGNNECSDLSKRHGIRFSIGMGNIRYVDRKNDIIDGPAIYISGRNLDAISLEKDYSAIELEGASKDLNSFLDSYVAMISNIVDSYSAKRAEVIFFKLLGYKERDISEKIGVFQSSVNMRATSAQWRLLHSAINDFENLNFEELCG